MQIPLEIVFHQLERKEKVEQEVQRRAEKLMHFSNRISRMRVTIEAPHRHHHHGNAFLVRIEIHLSGKGASRAKGAARRSRAELVGRIYSGRAPEITINRDIGHRKTHADAHIAIRDAFDAAERRVADEMRLRRHEVKHHDEAARMGSYGVGEPF